MHKAEGYYSNDLRFDDEKPVYNEQQHLSTSGEVRYFDQWYEEMFPGE